jgi:hypothetical protein
LYLRSFGGEDTDELSFHFIVHSALDLVEARGVVLVFRTLRLLTTLSEKASQGNYLGLLCPVEDYKVYILFQKPMFF